MAVRGRIELYTSVSILIELANKLRDKFQWDDREITYAMKHNNETDNKILECARAANADLIVTGDKHLLSLKEFSGIGITKVAGFLHTLEAK